MLEMLLEFDGHTVELASDGETGIALAVLILQNS